MSTTNALSAFESFRLPLMIDPQRSANQWIKNMEGQKERKFVVVKQSDPSYMQSIESAMQYGNCVLLEDVSEELSPSLFSLFRIGSSFTSRAMQSSDWPSMVQVGESKIHLDHHFCIYMTTRLQKPLLPPEISCEVNVLNFVVNSESLEDRFLNLVVAIENPSVEEQRQNLVIETAENRQALKEIENTILQKLSEAEGNIFDDEALINTLTASKNTSNRIEMKLLECDKLQKAIDLARMDYKWAATRGSGLYFCVAELSKINQMYQYSLDWFLDVFRISIANTPKQAKLTARVTAICDSLARRLFERINMSLYERDRLVFAFVMSIQILASRSEVDFDAAMLMSLLHGSTTLAGTTLPNPVRPNEMGQRWLTDRAWKDLSALSQLPSFKGFLQAGGPFLPILDRWKEIFESSDPALMLEHLLGGSFNHFQRTLVLTSRIGGRRMGSNRRKRKFTSWEWSGQLVLDFSLLNRLWMDFLVCGLSIPYARA
jgi:dynein heavy chain